ncbi:MAG TPA: DUF3857 domain-containing protein, partial [Thermoanaerobaculia bacterium]|nr:DUF3857 domain-containing protein [Thermoanaerobaculia bacterium]
MRSRSVRSLGPLIVVAALFGPVPAGAETPWSRPFEADPQAALKAAAAVTVGEDAGSIVLLEEGFLEFDGRGRLSLRLRHVVRILTAAGVEGWSSVERTWAPWHQSRPEIRARVLGADGSVHHLDQKTVSDAPAGESDPDLYSDRRIVRAPLPAVAPGAVVEQEITIRDLEPEFSAGTVHTFYFGGGFPTLETRLVVRYPPSLPLRTWSSPALGLAARKSETEGGTTLSWEAGRLDPLENFETGAPTDVVQTRLVRFSTGESWNTVARGYASIVDGQLGAAARVGKRPPADRGATIRQALARLQREVRYTGVEFSEASIVPRTPAETMSRRYGDCKDKAALLVARLREAGVPAFVALLETGPGADVRPELPGLAFDHAIVFVPGPPVVWIDPTDELSQAGELPSTDQGRLALVADAATTGLVRTFEAASADNRRLETREFRLRDEKGAALVETREATGQMARDERATFSWGDRKRRQEEIEEYAKSEYDARGKVRLETSDPRELSTPFRVRVEIDEVGRGMTDDHEAVVALFPAHLTRHLPASLLRGDGEEPPPDETVPRGRRKRGPRTQDFVILEPFRSEWNYRIHPPAGYEVAGLPADGEELVGSGRLSQSYRREADGSVSAALWFDSGRTRLSPAEFEGYRTAVAELWKRPAVFVRFAQKGMQSLAAGDVAGAISEFRRLEATRNLAAITAQSAV